VLPCLCGRAAKPQTNLAVSSRCRLSRRRWHTQDLNRTLLTAYKSNRVTSRQTKLPDNLRRSKRTCRNIFPDRPRTHQTRRLHHDRPPLAPSGAARYRREYRTGRRRSRSLSHAFCLPPLPPPRRCPVPSPPLDQPQVIRRRPQHAHATVLGPHDDPPPIARMLARVPDVAAAETAGPRRLSAAGSAKAGAATESDDMGNPATTHT
jgi:hypothetical protein